jgi:hypothetical protein
VEVGEIFTMSFHKNLEGVPFKLILQVFDADGIGARVFNQSFNELKACSTFKITLWTSKDPDLNGVHLASVKG